MTAVPATSLEWRVTGSYFEACNCVAICPCRSIGGRPGGRSTFGICEFALSWRIEAGHFGATRLDGLDVVLAGFYTDDEPGSPWRVVLYVDERATPEQHARVVDIFLGRAGGTSRGNYAGAVDVVHAIRSARVELEHEPRHWSIGVEGYVRVTAHELVACDETVACGIPGLDRPGQELRADILHVDDTPLAWEVRGRCAFATDFDYHSQPT
ncbi:MAG: DUF1326 domain-containing protein [Acidimicrobiia bacterium]